MNCIPSINETKSSKIVSYEYCDTTGYVYIPNVFNPSGEGTSTILNRKLFVFANSQYVNLIKYFAVYDQLGRRVFEEKNMFPNDGLGWDGKYKNAPLMSGIYMWYVEIEYLDGQIEKRSGDVALIYR
ncbi:MAG: gliding motility-associated C-terminal domain-containing protein [Saprospiraceae bacterium]|nr:gliding motility-associated C-terminal domain-containing protein [Saprospiraceae bacterium]